MRILVTGARGQLGTDLSDELIGRGHEVIGVDVDDMDITDADAVESFMGKTGPQAVIHCAAYTATDRAEDEPDVCRLVNSVGTCNIAEVCRRMNIKMLYISTDYVFGGEGEEPFKVDDAAAPLSVYGRTKYEGELSVRELVEKHFIVRTSWVFGLHGNNFVKTMLRLAGLNPKISAVADQVGSPTYTKDLSVLLADMIVTEKYGTYHASNEGYCSWYDFACEIFRQSEMTHVEVSPVASDFFTYKIKRPANSRLDKSKLTENGFSRLPSWQDALSRFLTELASSEAK